MTDQSDWPDWLKQADTKDAQVEILHDGSASLDPRVASICTVLTGHQTHIRRRHDRCHE